MKRNTFFLLTFSVVLLAAAFFPVSVLEVKQKRGGEVFFKKKVVSGEVFHFRYIHSVEKIPVEASFVVESNGFLNILETRYSSYGPGLPASQGEKIMGKGWLGVTGGGRVEKFTFFISKINEPSFKFKQTVLDLGTKMREGEIMEVSVKRTPILFLTIHIGLTFFE
jgi:hypothetical protein